VGKGDDSKEFGVGTLIQIIPPDFAMFYN